MQAAARDLGTLYRAQRKAVALESHDALFDLLGSTVRGLFPNLLRFGLYVANPGEVLATSEALSHATSRLAGMPGPVWFRRASEGVPPPHHVQDATPGLRMTAPLLDGSAEVGLIVVEALSGNPFTGLDFEILEAVAGLFSLALQRLRSRDTAHRRACIELDRRTARNVQRSLMTGSLPAGTGVRVDTNYIPAFDVGGDFYDLAYLGEGRVSATIGDVSGKGVSAALIMSRVSSDLGRAIRAGNLPSVVLEEVNATLMDVERETFVTATCIELDSRSCSLTVANAGHLPLIVRRASGEVLDFGSASGTPLGMIPCQYVDERVELKPLDIVLLMTDGLTDAFDDPDDRLGSRFLHRLVNSAPHDPKAINERILAAASEQTGTRSLDDVTLVALQLEAR